MRMIILGPLILGLLPCLAQAQSSDYSKGHGYGFWGAGGRGDGEVDMHLGGGGEFFFSRYVGAGAELGYVGMARNFDNGTAIFSANVVGRFRAKDARNRFEPFFTVGYTRFFPGEGLNVSGGVNIWFTKRAGFRFEIRDNILYRPGGFVGGHFAGARIGLTFR